MKKNRDFKECWACGMITEIKFIRGEMHHIFGRKNSDEVLPLCPSCHDFIDRYSLQDIDVFSYYLRAVKEFEKIPKQESIWIRRVLLKCLKALTEVNEYAKITRSKREILHNTPEESSREKGVEERTRSNNSI